MSSTTKRALLDGLIAEHTTIEVKQEKVAAAAHIIEVPSRSYVGMMRQVDLGRGTCSCAARFYRRGEKCWHMRVAQRAVWLRVSVETLLDRLQDAVFSGGCGDPLCSSCC